MTTFDATALEAPVIISSIYVESQYEGNIFENTVSTLTDAKKVRDFKVQEGATEVKIFLIGDDGKHHRYF